MLEQKTKNKKKKKKHSYKFMLFYALLKKIFSVGTNIFHQNVISDFYC